MNVDLRIAVIAARQHGVFTRHQAVNAGATEKLIRVRLRAGRWGRMYRTVFRLAGSPPTWDQKLFAAWLAGGEGAVVSHVAAGLCWKLPGMSEQLTLSLPRVRHPDLGDVVVHRVPPFDRVDRVEYRRLLVTTPTRTLIDLSRELDRDALDALLSYCLSRRMTTVEYLRRRIDALGTKGRRGVIMLRDLLDARPDHHREPESEFERQLLALLSRLPGPRPVPQFEVRLPDGRRRRLDVAYPALRLGIEAVSYAYHSSLHDWSADQSRYVELIAAGWRILPVTWVDVTGRPEWVLTVVEQAQSDEVCRKSAL